MKRVPFVMLAFAVSTAACAKKAPPATPVQDQTPSSLPDRSNGGDDEARRRAEEEARMRAERERRMASLAERVFFDYDRSDISSEAAAVLQSKLPILREEQTIRLRIEGHADERGSIEYNLALGLRRAESVRDYLAGFGIDGSRLVIESFGEDRPMTPGSNERAWAQNRRAEFVAANR